MIIVSKKEMVDFLKGDIDKVLYMKDSKGYTVYIHNNPSDESFFPIHLNQKCFSLKNIIIAYKDEIGQLVKEEGEDLALYLLNEIVKYIKNRSQGDLEIHFHDVDCGIEVQVNHIIYSGENNGNNTENQE